MNKPLALRSARIKNFKAIRDSGEIMLAPLTVFIGGNGSGKSSFIEALLTYQLLVESGLDAAMNRWRGFENIRNKPAHRQGQTLFIDARSRGFMLSRVLRDLTEADIAHIAQTYHNWRTGDAPYEDTLGFCKTATLDEIRGHGFVLTPGRYVGAAAQDEDAEPFAEKMTRLTAQLKDQFAESARLEQ